ncbi:hypothetical protein BAUCODRAFT_425300 [Baudoinia panamericana UAMH 10762]|uniref:Uncharacterized protein n=1 Tax=Baudoinia panamericana (strain UAMH 10762) TaxID=717646 RepID=M2MNY4_BAUPA|nr:uncharacterized protein BAUCODRAFT_425300 [Baudoinia panamericana UAMH 10762]EMC98406.1 hypothetical protein BAUCODRAFT_425300 [Baudoinia panamericana UAMH 10762]
MNEHEVLFCLKGGSTEVKLYVNIALSWHRQDTVLTTTTKEEICVTLLSAAGVNPRSRRTRAGPNKVAIPLAASCPFTSTIQGFEVVLIFEQTSHDPIAVVSHMRAEANIAAAHPQGFGDAGLEGEAYRKSAMKVFGASAVGDRLPSFISP